MKNNKTITIVSNKITRGDGQGRVNYEIAKAALSNDYRVNLITTEADHELVKLGANIIQIKKLPLPELFSLLYFVSNANRIVKKIQSKGTVVANGFSITTPHDLNIAHFVHFGWLNSGYYQPKMSLFKPKSWYYNLYTRLNCYFEKISFSRARKIVAVSMMISDELTSIGIAKEKITMIDNGVDCDEFYPTKKAHSKNLKLAFVGDLKSTRKNLETVFLAIQSIKNVQLLVVGNHENSIYPKLAKKFMVDEKVKFLGYSKNIAKILRGCDVFVFPSRYDPFGLVVMEAMASGLAVVTSKKVGSWQIANRANAGIIENPEDFENLKVILEKFVKHDTFREKCQVESRRIALDYDWKFVTKKYLKIIESL